MKAASGAGRLAIELASVPLTESESSRLATIAVRQRLSMPAQLELVFQGADEDLAGKVMALVGLTALVRGEPDATGLFQGDVTAVEHRYGPDGGLELRVRGYDPLHRLRKRQSVRGFADLDLAALAAALVEPIGLTVEARDGGDPRRQLVQWHQSDLGLLAEVTAAAGHYFAVSGDTVELFTLTGAGAAAIDLRLGDDLLEAEFELNGEEAFDSAAALGWDPTTGRRFEESAGEARSGRTAGARVPLAELGGEPTRTVANVMARDATEVRALAQRGVDRAVASQVVLRGVATGHTGIRPGATVRVTGVAEAFAGDYVVTEATHTLDGARGYLTEFGTAPPPPVPTSLAPAVAPGIVERVDDPEGLGRVTVSLPTVPSVATDWMRVVLPGLGSEAGLVALPSPGDEVLVLFPNGDPAMGVVLGGMFSGERAPDFGVEDGAVRRYSWRTRAGQLIELDEAEQRIRLRTPNGSAIAIGRDRLTIRSATDLEIAAPGKGIVIKAKTVDFQRAES